MTVWFGENATAGKSATKKNTLIASLWLLFFILVSCGGSGGNGDEESQEEVFPPVVFTADKDTNGTTELYASFDDGNEIIKLSETMVAGGNVASFEVSPDGIWVAYVADQDTNNLFELYVVPVDKASNESAVKVSVDLAGSGIKENIAGSGNYRFAWAPDSSRVAYIADAAEPANETELVDFFELFSSSFDGQEKDLISDLVDENSDVQDFQWEPLSTLIAYVADQDTLTQNDLYVAPADGSGSTVKISDLVPDAEGIREVPDRSGEYAFAWAPDSSRLAYIADQLVEDKFELFTSTSAGIFNLLISGPFGSDRDVEEFEWAPDSQTVAYTANQTSDQALDLYSAPPDSSSSSQKNSTGVGTDQVVLSFKWAPDSSRIAFVSDKGNTGFFKLHSVQPVNNFDIEISGGVAASSEVIDFKWSPNSEVIAFLGLDQDTELFTTFPDRLSSLNIRSLGIGGDVFEFRWAPNSSRIAYTADHDTTDVRELFSSTPDNRTTDQVSGELVSGGDVREFRWALDSSALGYTADQDTNDEIELYASQPNGDKNTKLSGDLVDNGDVFRFEWVP